METIELRLIFGNLLKEIRENRELSIRALARTIDFSAAYVSDLEKGNRLPTLDIVNRLNKFLVLTEEETKKLEIAYFTLHPNIPIELAYYIAKNDLIGTLQTLTTIDEEGEKIKKLVVDENSRSNMI